MRYRKMFCVLLGSAASYSIPAYAQDSAEGSEAQQASTGIIVTAQRREQLLQETPVAVTALSSETLGQLGISDVEDIARAVPNLQLLPVTANPSTIQVGLRGGSEQVGGLIVSEPVVGIYVDDVYRARLQGANAQLGDIERVEVLRGPQGTLYGRNNFSGAIKLVTRTPGPADEWFEASFGYGSFDTIKAAASVGQAFSDSLGGSISVLYRDQMDGWIYNVAQDQMIGEEENLVVRGKLALDNGPWKAALSVSYGRDENDGYIPVAVNFPSIPSGRDNFVSTDQAIPRVGTDPYVTLYPQETFGKTETFAASLSIEREFADVTLRSITGYVDLADAWRWDLAAGQEISPGVYSPTFDRISDADADQFTQEIQALGVAADNRLDWIVGAFFFRESGEQSLTDNIPLFFIPQLEPTILDIKTTSWAVFGQASYALSDAVGLTLGARYTEDKKEFDADIQSGFGMPNPRTQVSLEETFSSFTPKIGLDVELSDAFFAYASISKGFKAGGFNGLSILNPLVLSTIYDPQTVWAYEGGLKFETADRRFSANAAVFLNDISGLQQTAQIAPFSFAQQNVGDAELFGVELELAARPADGLNLFANIGYQDGDYTSLDPNAQAFTANATDLPLVTEWTWQTGFAYETDIADNFTLSFGADARYVGDHFVEVTNALFVNGYTRANGFIALGTADDRWKLELSAQNLTDEVDYVSGIVNVATPGLTVLRPRTLMLTLSFSN